jgi:hypothetical protein
MQILSRNSSESSYVSSFKQPQYSSSENTALGTFPGPMQTIWYSTRCNWKIWTSQIQPASMGSHATAHISTAINWPCDNPCSPTQHLYFSSWLAESSKFLPLKPHSECKASHPVSHTGNLSPHIMLYNCAWTRATQANCAPNVSVEWPSIQGVTGGTDQTSGGCSLC